MNAFNLKLASLLAACALLASAGCKEAATNASEQPVPKVTVNAVTAQEIIDADEYIGRTEASEIVEVRARIFGNLQEILFQDGDMVEEGQLLFKIEADEYEAIHNQSLSRIDLGAAKLELAKSKLARDKILSDKGAVSKEEYEESIAAVKEAEASIKAAEADAARTAVDLKYTEVKAPISGRIDRARVSKGALLTGGLSNGTLLTKIVQEQPMYTYFDVDEASLLRYMAMRTPTDETKTPGSLRDLNMACFMQLSNENDFPNEGLLDFVSAEVNAGTGTARIRGTFKNEKRKLASGLFVRVKVPISKPYSALLIPERSLATDQSIKFVYVVGSDKTAQRRAVTLGNTRGDLRIVKAGLQPGDRVIVKGLQRVKPGQVVDAEDAITQPTTAPAEPPSPPQER